MKTDDSIKNITVAAIRRHSIELETWTRTKLIDQFPSDVQAYQNELPIVFFKVDNENWTLITTQRIIGQFESEKREVLFETLDDVVWGSYKNQKIDKTIFRTSDFHGDQKDFHMETGYPSMAFVYGIQTIEGLTKSNM